MSTAQPPTPKAKSSGSSTQIARDLKERILSSEWEPGSQLPSENALAGQYAASRGTVRSALKVLAGQGVVYTRHGSGTFVTSHSDVIATSLLELRSMSELIKHRGMDALVEYHSVLRRDPTLEEMASLRLTPHDLVVETRRTIQADGEVAAFSFDAIRADVFGAKFDPDLVRGSLFALLDTLGRPIAYATAEVHAVTGADIDVEAGIGVDVDYAQQSFLGLYQTHFDADNIPVFYAKTYFREGVFRFSLLRRR